MRVLRGTCHMHEISLLHLGYILAFISARLIVVELFLLRLP